MCSSSHVLATQQLGMYDLQVAPHGREKRRRRQTDDLRNLIFKVVTLRYLAMKDS